MCQIDAFCSSTADSPLVYTRSKAVGIVVAVRQLQL